MRDWPVERVAHDWWVIDIDGVIEITWMPYPRHKRFETMVFGGPRSQDQRSTRRRRACLSAAGAVGLSSPDVAGRRSSSARSHVGSPCTREPGYGRWPSLRPGA